MNSPDLSQVLKSHKGASRRGKVILIAGAAILAVVGIIVWRNAAASGGGTSYVTEPIKRGDIRVAVNATGNLEPTNEVTVGSELSGTIRAVAVDTNDQVKKGQVLAQLDTSKLDQQTESSRATAAAAQARVEQTQATVVETEAALARLEKLKEESGGKLPSQADMDTAVAAAARAHADLASAEADVRQAKANVGADESDLQKTAIRSPIDGIILTRNVEPGQTVAATMTAPELFVVAENLKNMKLEVAVAEADIGRVKAGQQATFFVDAWPDRSFQATVKKAEYGSAVTDNVVTYKTDLEVSNDDLSLRPGMTATAEIAVAEAKNVLTVPNAALRFDPSASQSQADTGEKKSFVQSLFPGPVRRPRPKPPEAAAAHAGAEKGSAHIWVLKDGKPESIPVKTGLTDGGATEISGAGLSEGLPVIVHAQTATP
ncbi:MAG TPA: efflux RND transporter periplasmic adaptor subunit [Chthoniobacterales bacterium]